MKPPSATALPAMWCPPPRTLQHPLRGGEAHGGLHVLLAEAARDQRGPPVDGRVPHLARRVVGGIRGRDDVAKDARGEGLDVGQRHLPRVPVRMTKARDGVGIGTLVAAGSRDGGWRARPI